ncbi:MAG TPA: PE-PPE domain-containing protein, partial [Mycobacterium sp.]|nr:PE-PPE domain-containing protein [Mycobacterium sp.]
ILVGDPNNPAGGLFERFVGGSFPSFGWTLHGATPSDLYPTDIYTNEYDGIADFPRYPINFLSDLNAYVGIAYQHLTYAVLTPQQIAGATDLGTYGDTTYYMITTENLPLLDPLRYLPFGNPLADLLQPDLTVLVNLGYGSIYQGYDPGPPDVPTPFGLFPTNLNPAEVLTALIQGIPQGITKAIADIQTGQLTDYSSLQALLDAAHTVGLTPSDNPSLIELLGAAATYFNGDIPTTPITLASSPEDIVNILTSVASKDISTVLPFFDNGFAQGISMPNYDISLFLDNLEAGNLVGAIGNPIAANLGALPLAAISTSVPVIEAAATTLYDLFGGLVGGLVP